MAIVAQLVPSPIPSSTLNGSVPMDMFHVKISPASGAGTYTFAHGLAYTPTTVIPIVEVTQGSAPTVLVGWDVADTSSTSIAVNVSASATLDVYYG